MTNPTFRALCAELVNDLEEWVDGYLINDPADEHTAASFGRITRARSALAKQPVSTPYKLPEPVAPTDEELIRPIMWMLDDSIYDNDKGEIAQSLRELVARWGQP
jgi:hypothetical protein